MIFVSTGGYRDLPASKTAAMFIEHGLNTIELSGGLYIPELEQQLLSLVPNAVLQPHNYFPPSEQPFVLNLASLDDETAERSIRHVREGFRWAKLFNRSVFSVHAGFLIDPKPEELGKRIGRRDMFDRETALAAFISRVKLLAGEAASQDATLLIENNVLTKRTLTEFGANPLLMTTPEECQYVMSNVPSNVRLLVDVAHLKVSATTLAFDPRKMFDVCADWIDGYHLSDNDGTRDSNEPVRKDSWFWPHLNRKVEYYTLEIYNVSLAELAQQIEITRAMI